MSDEAVRIVRLEPMLAASFYAFGDEPEAAAWEQLKAWATRRGIWNDLERHPVFGFNNPGPDGDGPYGYEWRIRVDERFTPEGGVRLILFMGGDYAVTRCDDLADITALWQELWQWPGQNGYRPGTHQWLERLVGPLDEAVHLDLYCPIALP